MSYRGPDDALWQARKILDEAHPVPTPEEQARQEWEGPPDEDPVHVGRRRAIALVRAAFCALAAWIVAYGPLRLWAVPRIGLTVLFVFLALVAAGDAWRASRLLAETGKQL